MLILVFILAFATIVGLIWTGTQVFQEQEDPVGDRLAELQNEFHGFDAAWRYAAAQGRRGLSQSFCLRHRVNPRRGRLDSR